jgi:beta-glucosidase
MTDARAFGQHVDGAAERRIERIVSEMTVAELVGQMVGVYSHADTDDVLSAITDHHVGSVHFGDTPYDTPGAMADLANAAQEAAVDASRFDVPVFLRAMAEHGHAAVSGATVFPQQLGLGATRDPDLVADCAAVAATELRATGVQQTSSPIGDVARDARWGRIPETFGESPALNAELVAAMVRGYQERDDPVIAVIKHFPMYSEGVRGEDQAPNDVSAYTMRRVHLPPYAAGIEAGTGGIMPCYNAIEGEPVHGSERYLRDLLREELGFEGYVLADYAGAEDLHGGHGTSGSLAESLWRAVHAGVDLFPSGGPEYAETLVGLVEDGELSRERVAESARRVLRTKAALGLFEDPFVDATAAPAALGTDAHRAVARDVARESMTLLENDGLLPLAGAGPDGDSATDAGESAAADDAPGTVLVTGPNADDIAHQQGGWGTVRDPEPLGDTVLEGIREVAPDETTVVYEQGATVEERRDVDAAREAAADADVAVAVVGEPDYVHEFLGPEIDEPDAFPHRESLALPDAQRDLVGAVHDTGTPTVVVFVTGRPLATPWIAEHVPAVLMAYQPGSEGGAVADVLFGRVDPGGRLPVSVPRSEGQIPQRFNHLPNPVVAEDTHRPSYDPLWEYGHGLSYADFEYGDLSLSATEIGPEETVDVTVPVRNVSDRPGTAVVEAFVSDELSSRVTPVRELAGFERLTLDPGAEATASFTLGGDDLAVVDPDGGRRVEPGTFTVSVGDQTVSFDVVRRRPYDR